MIFYCTVSPWCARDAGTRCTSTTRVVENMCVTTFAPAKACLLCQHIRAARIDEAVADAFLTALAPAELDALSRARRAQQQVDTALRASADRQLEREADMPPPWQNGSSIRSIPTIVLSLPSSNAGGKQL